MSGSIVIAEMNDGKVSATTAELVSAALAYGSNPTLVIPCTSPSVADELLFSPSDPKAITCRSRSETRTCLATVGTLRFVPAILFSFTARVDRLFVLSQ